MYRASCLDSIPHGFLTRNGGKSSGLFDSLNFALAKGDVAELVEENRRIALERIGGEKKKLLTMNQVHGDKVVIADKGWDFNSGNTPDADAIMTQNPEFAVGVLTADCVPILLYDEETKTIAAIHAGWKGTNLGIVLKTVEEFQKLGSKPELLRAAIGPCIAQKNYEVGTEVYEIFKGEYSAYFIPSSKDNHFLFNLPGVVIQQLRDAGVGHIENTDLDTYQQEKDFFSCRRAFHKGETTFGCMLSAISLK